MNISLWDHLNERHSDKLTHRQRSIRHGIVAFFALCFGACLTVAIRAWFGNDVNPEQALIFAGSAAVVSVIYTAIDLLRGPRPTQEPELELTDEMSRRIR